MKADDVDCWRCRAGARKELVELKKELESYGRHFLQVEMPTKWTVSRCSMLWIDMAIFRWTHDLKWIQLPTCSTESLPSFLLLVQNQHGWNAAAGIGDNLRSEFLASSCRFKDNWKAVINECLLWSAIAVSYMIACAQWCESNEKTVEPWGSVFSSVAVH